MERPSACTCGTARPIMTKLVDMAASDSLQGKFFTEVINVSGLHDHIRLSVHILQCVTFGAGRVWRVRASVLQIQGVNRYHAGHEADVDIGMSSKLLSKHPSSFYLRQFHEEAIEILPSRGAGYYRVEEGELVRVTEDTPHAIQLDESPGGGILTIEAGDSSFDLCFPCEDGQVVPQTIDTGREVLGQIGGLDAAAREAAGRERCASAELAFVEVGLQKVELHYCASTENAEWVAVFQKAADADWTLGGIA